jgi:hypothetical protein
MKQLPALLMGREQVAIDDLIERVGRMDAL